MPKRKTLKLRAAKPPAMDLIDRAITDLSNTTSCEPDVTRQTVLIFRMIKAALDKRKIT